MEIIGTIKVIKPIQQISATFSKREFVIVTSEQYPQHIQLELHADRVDLIDAYMEGQEVICSLNIRGREWLNPQGETKYFNTIVCWKIQPVGQSQNQNQPQASQQNFNPSEFEPPNSFNEEEHDELPF